MFRRKHGYETKRELEDDLASAKAQAATSRKALKEINRQVHYTGQYLANKATYTEFCESKNKGKFRRKHSTEISLYESAHKFLKEQSSDGKLPSLKLLKEKKTGLLEQKKQIRSSAVTGVTASKNWASSAPMLTRFWEKAPPNRWQGKRADDLSVNPETIAQQESCFA